MTASKNHFPGRTDVSLVRELFSLHNIAATPENFRRFFERYVFLASTTLLHKAMAGRAKACWSF